MVKSLRLVFLAGDRREGEAARLLAHRGHRVVTCGCLLPAGDEWAVQDPLAAIQEADAVVGPALGTVGDGEALFRPAPMPPVPVQAEWLSASRPGTPWLIGRSGPWLQRAATAAGLPLVLFGERDDYAWLNAVPTAEGAVAEASRLAGRTAWSGRALVVGFGRCGQVLAARLLAWGAEVVCVARRPAARAEARTMGARAAGVDAMVAEAQHCEFLFNTVPAPLVTRRVLAALPPGAVVVDIASHPGGTDFPAAEALGVPARLVGGIPGRHFPATAGRILADVVEAILGEPVMANAQGRAATCPAPDGTPVPLAAADRRPAVGGPPVDGQMAQGEV